MFQTSGKDRGDTKTSQAAHSPTGATRFRRTAGIMLDAVSGRRTGQAIEVLLCLEGRCLSRRMAKVPAQPPLLSRGAASGRGSDGGNQGHALSSFLLPPFASPLS